MAKKKFDGRAASEGCVLLFAPGHVTAASVGGIEYAVDTDGTIEVPEAHAAELIAHGFWLTTPPA